MELKEIERIKEEAEILISKIIKTTEVKTGCVCSDIDVLINDNGEIMVDLNLKIKHKVLDY